MHVCSWVKCQSTEYRPDHVVTPGKNDDDEPVFSVIEHIVCTESRQVYLILNDLSSPEYCSHFHAYSFPAHTSLHSFSVHIVRFDLLHDHHSYVFHQSFDMSLGSLKFICLRYRI